jgi:hypothetical protein
MSWKVDIISEYCYGGTFNMLDEPDFNSDGIDSLLSVTEGFWISIHFPWLRTLQRTMPGFITNLFGGGQGFPKLFMVTTPFSSIKLYT